MTANFPTRISAKETVANELEKKKIFLKMQLIDKLDTTTRSAGPSMYFVFT